MKKEVTKPVILFFPFDLLSHYSRSIQLARSIKDKFQIYINVSGKYNDLVIDAGFDTFDCEIFDPKFVLDDSKKFKFSWLSYDNVKRVFESQVKAIEEYHPAFVIADTAPTLKMAAEFTNTKHIALMNGYMSKYYALLRKISKDNIISILQNRLTKNLLNKMTNIGEQIVFRFMHRNFNTLRKENNLQKQKMYLDELEGDYNLICDNADMFPQKNLPANYKIIGPLYYTSENKENEVLKFLENNKPSILANVGSSGELSRFAFLKNDQFKDFNIVITGDVSDEFQSPNIMNQKFINNAAILDKIDLVLCHAGNGTIYQSLSYGVPLICATSIFEQEWNAQRVEDLGYGTCIDDLKSDDAKIEVVKRWIDKKNTDHFTKIKKKIDVDETISKFKMFMETLI